MKWNYFLIINIIVGSRSFNLQDLIQDPSLMGLNFSTRSSSTIQSSGSQSPNTYVQFGHQIYYPNQHSITSLSQPIPGPSSKINITYPFPPPPLVRPMNFEENKPSSASKFAYSFPPPPHGVAMDDAATSSFIPSIGSYNTSKLKLN